jgi:hypothetical protein
MSHVFENARLRANPAYKAVTWNRLASEARQTLEIDPDSYGVLMPNEGRDLPVIAIDRDTALLFLSLQDPGLAPDFVFAMSEGESDRVLRRLIFDSILELEDSGAFIGGADACARLGIAGGTVAGRHAQLSIDALNYGAALSDADAITIAHKLYSYNRRPVTPALRRRLPDKAACQSFLGLGPADRSSRTIARFWSRGADDSPWLVFSSRQHQRQRPQESCKLYIGLAFEELRDCLPAVAELLAAGEATQFKIGTDLDGLLRPDKLVAYFPSRETLAATARTLLPAIASRTVHAVPFSAQIAESGALSWGMDPANAWLGDRVSWRQWMCEKLAAALVAARSSTAAMAVAPWQFALERLRLEGVNTDTFMPTGNWSGTT